MSTDTGLNNATIDGSSDRIAHVEWVDGRAAVLHVLWLRDNCPSGGDKLTAVRTFSVADLDPALALVAVSVGDDGTLHVEYSDGHRSVFDSAWLRSRATPRADTRATEPVRWRSVTALPRLRFDRTDDADGHRRLLEALVSHGSVLLDGVPVDPSGSEALAARLGPVRETDFGRFFDIVSEPRVWEMSQSTAALDPHTDDPYRYTPSGMSILHCIESCAGAGGESILVDGLAVAESIRTDRPDAFDLLASVAVPWVRYRADDVDQGAAVDLRAEAPVVRLDADGAIAGIRFHERSLAPLDLDPAVVDPYDRALIEFVGRIRDPSFQVRHRLAPGEALVFDNQRVLHGRTAFAGNAGRRHLRLCTIDRENVHSKLRLLRARCDAPGVDARLPSGNLA